MANITMANMTMAMAMTDIPYEGQYIKSMIRNNDDLHIRINYDNISQLNSYFINKTTRINESTLICNISTYVFRIAQLYDYIVSLMNDAYMLVTQYDQFIIIRACVSGISTDRVSATMQGFNAYYSIDTGDWFNNLTGKLMYTTNAYMGLELIIDCEISENAEKDHKHV